MALVRFHKSFIDAFPEIYSLEQSSQTQRFVQYMIDSRLRQTVELREWIAEQVANSKSLPKEFSHLVGKSPDIQAAGALRVVLTHLKYTPENDKWQMPEHWQTLVETWSSWYKWFGSQLRFVGTGDRSPENNAFRCGDCEDGAILLYILLRLLGVPASRLWLWCGDVQASPTAPLGGHCACLYKPSEYPLAWAILDWCYYPDQRDIGERDLFVLSGKTLTRHINADGTYVATVRTKYVSTWFCFNEESAITSVRSVIIK